MTVSVAQILVSLALAWLVRHLYHFYLVYKKLPSPAHILLFHHTLGLGALLPPFARFKRFSGNIGPVNWTGQYKEAAVGKNRLNEEYDYFGLISVFPVIAEIVVFDAAATKEIHTDRSRFDRPVAMRDILALFGPNMLTTNGKDHKRHRAISQPCFNDNSNHLVWRSASEVMRQMFDQHDRDFPGKDVIFKKAHDQTSRIALIIMSVAGFGRDMSWKDSAPDVGLSTQEKMSLTTALKIMTSGNNLLLRLALPKIAWHLPFKGLRTIDRGFKQFEVSMRELIQERLELQKRGEQRADILEALVGSISQPDGFTMSEAFGTAFLMLLAGHETSANSLAATLTLLSLNPEEQEKLHRHVQSVTDHGLHLEFEDAPNLDRVLACLHEAVRMMPPIAFNAQQVKQPTSLSFVNLKSPVGAVGHCHFSPEIMVDSGYWPLHFNPRYFKDPHTYNPDRFLTPEADQLPFYGFSLGAYSCLGRRFAEFEMINVLSSLVLRYRFEPVTLPGESATARNARCTKTSDGLTLRPANIDLRFIRR